MHCLHQAARSTQPVCTSRANASDGGPLFGSPTITLSSVQKWLSIPCLHGVPETELAANADGDTGKCIDPDFPPTPQSLYADPEHPPATAPTGADWKRVHGQLYVPSARALKVLPVRLHLMPPAHGARGNLAVASRAPVATETHMAADSCRERCVTSGS